MKRVIALAALAAATAGCLPTTEKQMIVVDGEGVVMATPEVFKVSAILQTREATQAGALSKVSGTLSRIASETPKLEGLDRLEIDPSNAEIRPVYNIECARASGYGQDSACPVEGYIAKIEVLATGAPAGVAGNTLSLLSELGAQQVELKGYSLVDYNAAQAKAASEAMKSARTKAENLANAAGATLGAPTRIQYGEGFDEEDFSPPAPPPAMMEEQIVVTGSRIAPATNLVLTPQPFEVREKVVAAFALE